MYTDTIADLLTRIRNAYMADKSLVSAPYSRQKMDILKVLKNHNFINDYKEVAGEKTVLKNIEITLNPNKTEISIKRISKPGQRIYAKSINLKKVNGGLGISIVSTPKGIMNGAEARKLNLGGEIICEVI